MDRYREAEESENFDYGVVTYLDGEREAVTAEGYVAGSAMGGNDESVVVVAHPDRTLHLPFDRVVKLRYPTEE